MLVIFHVIYVNLCDCELSPAQVAIIYVHIEICIFINVTVFYLYFQMFLLGRAQVNNFFHFLVLYMLVCVNKF